jgi:hypothetical protein
MVKQNPTNHKRFSNLCFNVTCELVNILQYMLRAAFAKPGTQVFETPALPTLGGRSCVSNTPVLTHRPVCLFGLSVFLQAPVHGASRPRWPNGPTT